MPFDRRPPKFHVLAAGRTFRDYGSFCKGLGETNADCTLVCPQAELGISIDDVPRNCRVHSGGNPWALQESEFSDLILNASAVAIPLRVSYGQPIGLTSLLEAMAHGALRLNCRWRWESTALLAQPPMPPATPVRLVPRTLSRS